MFKKMSIRIYVSLMLTVVTMLVSISVPCLILLSRTLIKTYDVTSYQKLDRSISSCKNYVNSILLTAHNLSLDSEIIQLLSTGTDPNITFKLDAAANNTLKIDGITIYNATNETIYSSSNIKAVPTLNELQANQNFNDFVNLSNVEYVLLRTSIIASSYNDKAYDAKLGMVSCCRKVFNEKNAVIGYIVIDIFPSRLYEYFKYDADIYFSGTVPFICFANEFFPYENNADYLSELNTNFYIATRSQDNKYLLIPSNRNFYGGLVKIAVPLTQYKRSIITISIMLLAASLSIVVSMHFIAKRLSSNINSRLTKLYSKMENTTLLLK